MSESTQKQLTDRALQCIQLARTIADRFPDRATMPGEEAGKIQALQKEAAKLRGLAQAEFAQDELEKWKGEPGDIPDALAAHQAAAAKAGEVRPDAGRATQMQMEQFAKAMRLGKDYIKGLDQVSKANLVEDATGEVIVPHDIAGPIFKTLPRLGVFRDSGPTIRPTTSNKVDLRSLTTATAGWGKIEVLGAAPPDPFGTASTPADVIEVHDLMGLVKLGVDELADTDANLVSLIQDIIGQIFAQTEDDAFAAGNGVSKPWGLAARATAAGNQITQAVTASATATVKGDELKSLQYRVPARFRTGGAYFASADAAEAIALLKDSTSNYLWQPAIRAGEPDTLFGKRFYTLEGLPAMTATSTIVDPSVIFGDPSLGYLIADRQRITVQRLEERYAELGLVGFLFKLRVGGDVMRPAAFAKYLL